MENNNIQIIPVDAEEDERSSFDFNKYLMRCWRNWLWFVLSAIICLGAASLVILHTRPVYTRSATVMIKENGRKSLSSNDIEAVLSLAGGSSIPSKVANEVIVFQSPALMQKVVKSLDLTTEYLIPKLLRNDVIYGIQVPVNVEFIDVAPSISVSFRVLPDNETIKISKFTYTVNKKKHELNIAEHNFGDTINTGIGRIVINRNQFYSGTWEKPVIVNHKNLDLTTAAYCKHLSAIPSDDKNNADLINIILKDNSAQRADDILSMLVNAYNESWVEDKNRMAVNTSEFIKDRLISLEEELGEVDNEISDYKSENLLPDPGAVSSMYMAQAQETSRQQQELDNQLRVLKFIKGYLTSNPGIEDLIPGITSLGNNSASAEISEYNTTLLKRNNIRANSSSENPLVKDLDATLFTTRNSIETDIDSQIATLNAQLANLRGIEKMTNTRIAKNPTQAKYLLSVGRQQKVKESLYLFLLQKREENELSKAFSAYNTRIITPPMGIALPSAPQKMKILLTALLIGIFIPLILIYILEATDTKIHSKEDLKSLSVPYIGEIPLHHKESGSKNTDETPQILVKHGCRDFINEAFRVARTNLEFMNRGVECPVVAITSFNQGSGKSFSTMNIAAAVAIKNNRVLAIDGDLRRASLSAYINCPKQGISNFLSGEIANVHEVICKVEGYDTLHLLPVGQMPPNPTELIANGKLAEMLENLKKEYDCIFIDCPPIDIVADAKIISEHASRCIFILRAGLFDKRDIPNLQKVYDNQTYKNFCYALNAVESQFASYGHYGHYGSYGYGKGYGYGYGYGNEHEKKKYKKQDA